MVKCIIHEQNILEAYDSLELFCELITVQMPIIELQRECPVDLQEAIASVIFAAPLSSDIPELLEVQNMFALKYGNEFVAAATELRPGCRVNRQVIEKLSTQAPSVNMKLNVMKEIAKEHGVVWDSANTEREFSKLPEDLLDGPNQFIGASGMAMILPANNESQFMPMHPDKYKEKTATSLSPQNARLHSHRQSNDSFEDPMFVPSLVMPKKVEETTPNCFYSPPRESSVSWKLGLVGDSLLVRTHSRTRSEGSMNLQDIMEAAEAAAESAEKAAQAARAVAALARSRIYKKMPGQPQKGGMHPMCSGIEQEASFDIKSKPYFTEETDNMHNEFQSVPEGYEHSQEDKYTGESGLHDMFDNAKNLHAGESIHVDGPERGNGFVIESSGDDNYNAMSILYPQALVKEGSDSLENVKFTPAVHLIPEYLGFMGESREGHQHSYDALGPGEDEMRNPHQPQRLPSLEDDPYFTYPNLFSQHSSGR